MARPIIIGGAFSCFKIITHRFYGIPKTNASKGKVLKTTAAGNVKATSMTLGAVGSITYTDTSNLNVPTIGAVATLSNEWGGSAKTVSTSAPTGGDGADGDFWFVREA